MSRRKVPSDDILRKLYLEEKLSSGIIASRYGVSRAKVCEHLRRLGITRPESGVNSRNRNFNKRQFKHGYPMTFLPDHPRANNIGYVFDHMLVMEKAIGRTPSKVEHIHHIDYDRTNCNLSNLYLCNSNREHQLIHRKIEKMIKELYDKGIIGFKDGEYYLK